MPAQNGQYEPGYACHHSLQASVHLEHQDTLHSVYERLHVTHQSGCPVYVRQLHRHHPRTVMSQWHAGTCGTQAQACSEACSLHLPSHAL